VVELAERVEPGKFMINKRCFLNGKGCKYVSVNIKKNNEANT